MAACPLISLRAVSLGSLSGLMGYHIAQAAVTTYAAFDAHIGRPFGLRKVVRAEVK